MLPSMPTAALPSCPAAAGANTVIPVLRPLLQERDRGVFFHCPDQSQERSCMGQYQGCYFLGEAVPCARLEQCLLYPQALHGPGRGHKPGVSPSPALGGETSPAPSPRKWGWQWHRALQDPGGKGEDPSASLHWASGAQRGWGGRWEQGVPKGRMSRWYPIPGHPVSHPCGHAVPHPIGFLCPIPWASCTPSRGKAILHPTAQAPSAQQSSPGTNTQGAFAVLGQDTPDCAG